MSMQRPYIDFGKIQMFLRGILILDEGRLTSISGQIVIIEECLFKK